MFDNFCFIRYISYVLTVLLYSLNNFLRSGFRFESLLESPHFQFLIVFLELICIFDARDDEERSTSEVAE